MLFRSRLTIGKQPHIIKSTSWTGLGQDEARRAMLDDVARSNAAMKNPCYPDNTSAAAELRTFDNLIDARRIDNPGFDFQRCSALYREHIARAKVGEQIGAIPTSVSIVAFSSVYFAFNDWKAISAPGQLAGTLSARCSGDDAWGLKVMPALKIGRAHV